MTFEEYRLTKDFERSLKRSRWVRKRTWVDVALAAMLLVCSVVIMLLQTNDAVKDKAWVLGVTVGYAAVVVVIGAAEIATCVLCGAPPWTDPSPWHAFRTGLCLYMRDLNIDWTQFLSNGVLDVPVFLPASSLDRRAEAACAFIGDTRLDFTPWGKLDVLGVLFAVSAGMMPLLESPPMGLLSAGVHVRLGELQGTDPKEGGFLAFIKSGKWTLTGRGMRRSVRVALRRAAKIEKKR